MFKPVALNLKLLAQAAAISAGLLLANATQASAQFKLEDLPFVGDSYRKTYNEGYEAGLRAAKAQAASQSHASSIEPNPSKKDAPTDSLGVSLAETRHKSTDTPSQESTPEAAPPAAEGIDNEYYFHHSQTSPFWISGQGNFIAQYHPRFYAQYSGHNSFEHASEQAVSRILSLYLGYEFDKTTDLIVSPEETGWSGLSQGAGLGGFPNADVVKNPQLSAEPYLARLWIRKVIPLSDETIEVQRTPLSMLTTLPVRRIELRFGKFALPDYFDVNGVGSDSHQQFMNWTTTQNGAWDFAADTRGYTYAEMIEYDDRQWSFRFADAMEPTTPNGEQLEYNLQRAHSENFEFDLYPTLLKHRFSAIRVLSFLNSANMGNYHDAIDQALTRERETGKHVIPDIDNHPKHVTQKYGFGLNLEQEFTDNIRGFFRTSWNDGQTETWAFTEVDESVSLGGDLRGTWWRRPDDKWGVAFVVNGISRNHREYLKLGGLGFDLGDGNLRYGPEEIMETYYNLPLWFMRGLFGAVDLQYINNPGYNRVRGPVIVPGIRLHLDL